MSNKIFSVKLGSFVSFVFISKSTVSHDWTCQHFKIFAHLVKNVDKVQPLFRIFMPFNEYQYRVLSYTCR
jgi:hypothetical protein